MYLLCHFNLHRKWSNRKRLGAGIPIKETETSAWKMTTRNTLFFYKNIVFPAQAEYSYFSSDFRLKIFCQTAATSPYFLQEGH